MIKVDLPPPPPIFAGKQFESARDRLFGHYLDYTVKKRQSRFDWGPVQRVVRKAEPALAAVYRGKCAYCESRLGTAAAGVVDQYRPKRGARGFDRQFSDIHYWWLALEWSNLLYVCPQCNRFKGSWFPLEEGARRADPETYGEDLEAENPLLLNPFFDDPEEHLDFVDDGSIRPRSERGQVTIEILRLDREELGSARRQSLQDFRARYLELGAAPRPDLVRELVAVLNLASDAEYLAAKRQALFAWLKDDPEVLELLEDFSQPEAAPDGVPETRLELAPERGVEAEEDPDHGLEVTALGAGLPDEDLPDEDFPDDDYRGFAVAVDDEDDDREPTPGKGRGPFGPPSPPSPVKSFDIRQSTSNFEQKKAAYAPETLKIRHLDLKQLPIKRIKIHNFKNIADLTIDVPQDRIEGKAPWQLFLGKNAVGKSAILQALVLTLMGQDNLDRLANLHPKRFLRYFKKEDEATDGPTRVYCQGGSVEIWITGSKKAAITLSFDEERFISSHKGPGTYLLAYGATRLLPSEDPASQASSGHGDPAPAAPEGGKDPAGEESERMVRVQNLFHPAVPLIDVSRWLFRLYHRERDKPEAENQYYYVVRALRSMLLMEDDEDIWPDEEDENKIWIELNNELATLDAISDGYRTILAIAADIIHVLLREGTSMEEAEGIVIIDEIGANLHPGWKKRIVGCFREVFPRTQFIVTSHSPLCLRGLEGGETVLLRRDLERKIVAVTDLPNPKDMRVDQILASEFFGLSTTLESDLEDIYDEYYQLLLVKDRSAGQEGRLRKLKKDLRQREHLGSGLRDELMYEVIDQLVARQLHSPKPKPREPLKLEAVKKVFEAWKDAGLEDGELEEAP